MAMQRQQAPKHGEAVVTVIGEGIQVVGRVDGREDVRVQGYVEGTVTLSEVLLIDPGGIVVGGVRVRELVVHGVLVGDAIASARIVLHPGARVVGDLQAPRIIVHAGAALRGQLSMGEGEDEAPQEAAGGGRQGMGRWRSSSRIASSAAPAPRPAAPRPVRVTRNAAARPTGILARGGRAEATPEPPGPRVPLQRPRPSVRESIREQIRDRAPAPPEPEPEPEAFEPEPLEFDEADEADEADALEDTIDVDDGTITTSNGKKQAARPRVPARGKHSVEG